MSIDSETIGFGSGLIEILNVDGDNDGYYWDYRIFFKCDNKPYTYINVGSISGYIDCYIGIKHGIEDLPKGNRLHYLADACTFEKLSDADTLKMLYKAVQLLIASGEYELELSEDDVDVTSNEASPVVCDEIAQAPIDKIIETRTEAIYRRSNRSASSLDYISNCFSRYSEDEKLEKIDKLNDNIEKLLSLLTYDSDYDPPTTSSGGNKKKK